MAESKQDVEMGEDGKGIDIHEPFTVEENIQQLNAIDESIVQLMSHTATSLNALSASIPPASTSEAPQHSVDPESQKAAFRQATDSFLTTLHSVDVRMKRHIFALEEAGIVDLTQKEEKSSTKSAAKASLKPNGVGDVGNLDVGWLNSRSSRVERDMERELWEKTRKFLEQEGSNLRFG